MPDFELRLRERRVVYSRCVYQQRAGALQRVIKGRVPAIDCELDVRREEGVAGDDYQA